MYNLPTELSKIRERIRRYERAFAKEEQEYGMIHDGSGKRYLLGLLYLLNNDTEGAIKSFQWFEKTFPDDIGDPLQYLCWTLALYRKGHSDAASNKLIQTMLKNLYIIPHLLRQNPPRLNIWHGSNREDIDYLSWLPPIVMDLCTEKELDWISEKYHSARFTIVRDRYINIHEQLKVEPRGPKRTELVRQAFRLEHLNFSELRLR